MRKIAIVLGLLAIAVVVFFAARGQKADDDSLEPNTIAVTEGGNFVYVPDQGTETQVTAAYIILKQNGFLVVRESQGSLGEPIGNSSLIVAGEYDNITVDLNKEMEDRKMYFAMLFVDDGDGIFDFSKDAPAKDSVGNNMYTIFNVAEGNAPIPVGPEVVR